MFLYRRRYEFKTFKKEIFMVGKIQALNLGGSSNFSIASLNYIQSEVKFADTDISGNFTDEEQQGFSVDAANAVKSLGTNKNIFSQKISDMIIDKNKKPETSKEAAPDMDLSLDDDVKIPSPPTV